MTGEKKHHFQHGCALAGQYGMKDVVPAVRQPCEGPGPAAALWKALGKTPKARGTIGRLT